MKNKFLATLFLACSISTVSAQTPVYMDDAQPIEARVKDALSRMTLEEKVALCHAQSKFSSAGVPRLGIPELWMSDGPHGVRAEINWNDWGYANWTNDSITAFPALTCLAATWNPDMSAKYGKAIGEEARLMIGRTPGNIVAVRPLRQGVISDYSVTEKMLKYFVHKSVGKSLFGRKPRISVCVPSGVTEVEKKAVEDATYAAGARDVKIIEEPVAAAIGAGIDIAKPCGNMIVDIGGGTSDIAVISLGGTVVSTSIKVAGDDFDEAIVRYMRKKHNLLIGDRTAEDIKIQVGSAYTRAEESSIEVRGRNLVTGLPKTVTVTSEETREALREATAQIVEAVHSVLERTPPELAADISDRGIVLTGGGSMLQGLEQLIEEKTGITTMTADDPMTAVAIGTGQYIEYLGTK